MVQRFNRCEISAGFRSSSISSGINCRSSSSSTIRYGVCRTVLCSIRVTKHNWSRDKNMTSAFVARAGRLLVPLPYGSMDRVAYPNGFLGWLEAQHRRTDISDNLTRVRTQVSPEDLNSAPNLIEVPGRKGDTRCPKLPSFHRDRHLFKFNSHTVARRRTASPHSLERNFPLPLPILPRATANSLFFFFLFVKKENSRLDSWYFFFFFSLPQFLSRFFFFFSGIGRRFQF